MSKGGFRVQVKATGMDKYAKKLQKMGKNLEELDKPMKEAGKIGMALAQSYPPYNGKWQKGQVSFQDYRPGSKYKRTRTLQAGWRGRLVKGSRIVVRFSISNNSVKYTKYVVGKEQDPVHGPWWIRADEYDTHLRPYTLKIFQDFMKKVAKS